MLLVLVGKEKSLLKLGKRQIGSFPRHTFPSDVGSVTSCCSGSETRETEEIEPTSDVEGFF